MCLICMAASGLMMPTVSSLLLDAARGAEGVDGEVDGLVLGLDSCGEEEHQASATESYLRRGLVEQGESAPVPWSGKDLDSLVTSSLPAQPTWMAAEPCMGTSRSP